MPKPQRRSTKTVKDKALINGLGNMAENDSHDNHEVMPIPQGDSNPKASLKSSIKPEQTKKMGTTPNKKPSPIKKVKAATESSPDFVDKGFYIDHKKSKSPEDYQSQIKKLKAENERLKKGTTKEDLFPELQTKKLKNNFKKFLEAIAAESDIQRTDWPTISTNRLRKHYKVAADSFKECLSYGLTSGRIQRKVKPYSGNVSTWCYKAFNQPNIH